MKIMAPAGGQEAFDAALKAGADEIYMGMVGFGARRFAQNFGVDEYCRAIETAHRFGVAINLTFNTLMADAERESVLPALRQMYNAGLDAVIIQDMGAADFLWSNFPGLQVHASTQLSLSTPRESVWAAQQGFSRLVLARELSLNEIQRIRTALNEEGYSKTELEVFASGALCLCCSGKCLLSSFMGGRSGNRGACAQPCRLGYSRTDAPTDAKPDVRRYLSLKDQWQERIDVERMAAAGVDVIKLEGRMKSPEYVFQAVRYYRLVLDELGLGNGEYRSQYGKKTTGEGRNETRNEGRNETGIAKGSFGFDPDKEAGTRLAIAKTFNRGYAKGYLYEHDPPILNPEFSANWGVPAGRVKKGVCRLSQPLVNGDGIVYLDKNLQKLDGSNVSRIVLFPKGTIVLQAFPGDLVSIDDSVPREAAYIWKTYDHLWQKKVSLAMDQTMRQIPIRAAICAFVGQKLKIRLERTYRSLKTGREEILGVERESDAALEPSQKQSATEESLQKAFDRFGGTIFALDSLSVQTDGNAFVPLSLINNLRQQATQELERKLNETSAREPNLCEASGAETNRAPELKSEVSVGDSPANLRSKSESNDPESLKTGLRICSACVWTKEQALKCRELGFKRIYRAQVPTCFDPESEVNFRADPEIGSIFSYFPLAATLEEAIRLQNLGVPFALDTALNITNVRALAWYEKRFPAMDTCFLSVEALSGAVWENKTKESYSALERLTRSTDRPLGLVLYGRVRDMYTRKTLFDEPMVPLSIPPENQIRLRVYRNRDLCFGATGSSVYLDQPVDYISQNEHLFNLGIQELRFDFTWETPDEIERIANSTEIPNRAAVKG